jgi:hypothetical protein
MRLGDRGDEWWPKTLPDSESGPLVEHLQVCESCRERLDAEIEFVTAMRGAAAKIRRVNVNRKGGHESEKDSQANSQD